MIKKIALAIVVVGFMIHSAFAMQETVRKKYQEWLKKNPKTLVFFGTYKYEKKEDRLSYIAPLENIEKVFEQGRFGVDDFGSHRDDINEALETDDYISCKLFSGQEALIIHPYDKNPANLASICQRAGDLYKYKESLWLSGWSDSIVPFTEDEKYERETKWWWQRS
ncbi:MAG TPA: hypothetical protein VKR54_01055 [Candidatus Babeliales bacterium]|jgi:hypothetical protein|nr:hypothetical protein [Candidatus Babeliales bacterium]